MAKNYWTDYKGKRIASSEINASLAKYVGHKIDPIDDLFAAMRKIVLKYFKANVNKLPYFTIANQPFDYNFEVEELAGHVTKVTFIS